MYVIASQAYLSSTPNPVGQKDPPNVEAVLHSCESRSPSSRDDEVLFLISLDILVFAWFEQ